MLANAAAMRSAGVSFTSLPLGVPPELVPASAVFAFASRAGLNPFPLHSPGVWRPHALWVEHQCHWRESPSIVFDFASPVGIPYSHFI